MNVERPTSRADRVLVFAAVLIAFAAVAVYMFRMSAGHLTTPWYVPITATAGLTIVGLTLLRRRTAWRIGAFALLAVLTAFEWWFILGFTAQPPYQGPVSIGKPAPEFIATRADNSSFTSADLKSDKDTILVFFRGRW